MRARTAIASTALRVRLTGVGCGLTILTCVALSACTPSGTGTSSPSSSVTVLSPTAGGSSSSNEAFGGGTAGFQDAGLAVLGGAAIAAGLASIAYRRRITRRR